MPQTDLEELDRQADEVFKKDGKDYTDADFGLDEEEELEDGIEEDEFEFDEDDEPEDARPRSTEPEDPKFKTLDEIIEINDLDEDPIWIEKWDCHILIRSVTKREFDFMRQQARRKDARGRVNDILERELICSGVVKPRISRADYQRLQEKSPGPLVQILNAIYKKSGLEQESEKERERRFPAKR